MSLNQEDCERALASMSPQEQALFLCRLGHTLTVVARSAYEFQAPGVVNPRLLRDLNEIHHRIYPQILGLIERSSVTFDAKALASWLAGEGRSKELQSGCLWAFEQGLSRRALSTQQALQADAPSARGLS